MASPTRAPAPAPEPASEKGQMALGASGWAVIRAMDACSSLEDDCEFTLNRALIDHWQFAGSVADPVPYQWQVGCFIRHGLGSADLFALRQLAMTIMRSPGPDRQIFDHIPPEPSEYWARALVMLCLEYSLHPTMGVALQLFRDVLAAVSDVEWTAPRRHLFYCWTIARLGEGPRYATPAHKQLHTDEFLAKVALCIHDEVHFPPRLRGGAEDNPLMQYTHLPPRTFALVVDWCLARSLDAHSHGIALDLFSAAERSADRGACAARRLCDFIHLHWPTLTAPGNDTLNSAQSTVVHVLADHVARHSLGTSQVIPHILDYIRAPSAGEARLYRQIEAQTAHAAFGRAQLAHAAAATSKGPAPASAPTHKRARAEEEESPKRPSA